VAADVLAQVKEAALQVKKGRPVDAPGSGVKAEPAPKLRQKVDGKLRVQGDLR
jgi:hypothetical protein